MALTTRLRPEARNAWLSKERSRISPRSLKSTARFSLCAASPLLRPAWHRRRNSRLEYYSIMNRDRSIRVSAHLIGSDLLLVHAPGATRPMTLWRAGIFRRYAAARVMKTSVSWSPTPSPNVVSVQRGEQAAADVLSEMRYAVQIASQRVLANASGSVRPGGAGHHYRTPGALEVSKPAV
jgi:hypothetical protein